MPARSFRFKNKQSKSAVSQATADKHAALSSEPPAKTAPVVTPMKSPSRPSRTRKQTEHYNPLEENKKPQHQHSTSPNRKQIKIEETSPQQITKPVERNEEPLVLEPVSKELLCDHCNFEGDLMQCHAFIGESSNKYSRGIGCGKLVHPFCVGREVIPKGGWICSDCSLEHGYRVKLPKELRNKDIVDYGHEFSSDEPSDKEYQQLEEELLQLAGEQSKGLPENLFRAVERGEDTEDDNDEDDEDAVGCAHSKGPCDICKVEGELIQCHSQLTGIGCGKSVHMYCVFLDEIPEGDWVCQDCATENNLKLDKKFPARGYEYPIAEDFVSAPKYEDTFEWSEALGYRIRVASRIGIYDEDEDEYNYGTVEHKDVGSMDYLHILFDDGKKEVVCMRGQRIRLLSEYHPSPTELKMRMQSSLDPSLPHYIICGGGVTKAHDRKHAHRLLEHCIEVLLGEDDTVSLDTDEEEDAITQRVLEKLKDDGIEFIQWDATIGGFGKASKKEIKNKIVTTFEEKQEERAQMPQAEPSMMALDNNGRILHVLLVNGGHPLPKIPPKQVSDDPFGEPGSLQEWRWRFLAREPGIVESNQDAANQSTEPVSSHVWDSDIFDDAPGDITRGIAVKASKTARMQKVSRLPLPALPMPQYQTENKRKVALSQEVKNLNKIISNPSAAAKPPPKSKRARKQRKETFAEVLAKSRGKLLPAPPPKKKRGRQPKSTKTKKEPPAKKLKRAPKAAPNSNSTQREVKLCERQHSQWAQNLKRAVKFRKKHGHCNVPSQYPADPVLATWAKRQRHQYQLFLRKHERCTMTPERIEALGKIDFCFDTQQIKWLQKYEELKEYFQKHGHCRPSATKRGEQKLGAWVKHQRAQKKLFDAGQPSFITKNRVDMLDSIGFTWKFRS